MLNTLYVECDVVSHACSMHGALCARSELRLDVVDDPSDAIRRLAHGRYDLVLLGLAPDALRDGARLCNMILGSAPNMGVIVLSSRGALEHKLTAFEAGADDYIETPCDPREVVARARAVLRRSRGTRHADPRASSEPPVPTLDVDSHAVRGPSGGERLTPTELRLLRLLATDEVDGVPTERLAFEVLSRDDIYARNLVHRHVSNLRRKLDRVGFIGAIERSRNGYRLSMSVHWLGRQAMCSVQT
jgi:DNA-binding response OmpR family regulator